MYWTDTWWKFIRCNIKAALPTLWQHPAYQKRIPYFLQYNYYYSDIVILYTFGCFNIQFLDVLFYWHYIKTGRQWFRSSHGNLFRWGFLTSVGYLSVIFLQLFKNVADFQHLPNPCFLWICHRQHCDPFCLPTRLGHRFISWPCLGSVITHRNLLCLYLIRAKVVANEKHFIYVAGKR